MFDVVGISIKGISIPTEPVFTDCCNCPDFLCFSAATVLTSRNHLTVIPHFRSWSAEIRICWYRWLQPTCQAFPHLTQSNLIDPLIVPIGHFGRPCTAWTPKRVQAPYMIRLIKGPWSYLRLVGWDVRVVHQLLISKTIAWCFLQAAEYKYIALGWGYFETDSSVFLVSFFCCC